MARLIERADFQKSLTGATSKGILGKGSFGAVHHMETTFNGEKFEFARKIGHRGAEEVDAMRASSATVAPSVYRSSDDMIDMELLTGKTLKEIDPQKLGTLEKDVVSAISQIHKTGYVHRDTHLGNIILSENAGKQSIGMIDFGFAERITKGNMQPIIEEEVDYTRSLISQQSSLKADMDDILAGWNTPANNSNAVQKSVDDSRTFFMDASTNIDISAEMAINRSNRTGVRDLTAKTVSTVIDKSTPKQTLAEDVMSTNVEMKKEMVQRAIEKKRRFYELSKQSVAAGAKSGHKAGKRHSMIRSTTSA